jgi:hypothetical protein
MSPRASIAAPPQALFSEATLAAANCNPAGLQRRQLDLKGRTAPSTVYVIGRDPAPIAA